jgi:hypothetical protein
MKKFSFGVLAAALLASPVFGDEPAPEMKLEVCPLVDANAVVCTDKCAQQCEHEVMMTTMVAIEGEVATNANVDPSLMFMTGVVDDSAGAPREEGENFRDLSIQTLGGVSTTGGGARFEGLTQVAAERRGFGVERTGASAGDRSSLKAMLFGNKTDVKTKTTLVANDRVRMQKMAEVDLLRDKALKTGDAKLLAKADAMEKELKINVKAKSKFSLFGRK